MDDSGRVATVARVFDVVGFAGPELERLQSFGPIALQRVAARRRAMHLGAGGRRFESGRPDQFSSS